MSAKINQAIKTLAVNQRLKVRPDQNVRRRLACLRVAFDADWAIWTRNGYIIHMGHKGQNLSLPGPLSFEIDGDKRRVIDGDSHLLDRGNKEEFALLAL